MFLNRNVLIILCILFCPGADIRSASERLERPDLNEADWARVKTVTAVVAGKERYEKLSGGAGTSLASPTINSFSFAAKNLSFEGRQKFQIGNGLFTKVWVSSPSSTKASDGLGPVFNVRSCQRCHLKDGRGHPPNSSSDLNASMVLQLSINDSEIEGSNYMTVLPDPNYGFQLQDNAVSGVSAEGAFTVLYEENDVVLNGGEIVKLRQPTYLLRDLAHGPLDIKTSMSPRVAQPMIGLGLLEAIHQNDILKLSDPDDKNNDGISGRPSWVLDRLSGKYVLGRFGWKAGQPSVRAQTQAAFLTDMGLSTPQHKEPWGDCTEAQTLCRNKMHGDSDSELGIEVSEKFVDFVTFYAKNLAVPARRDVNHPQVIAGKKVFIKAGCGGCHVAKFVTSRDAEQEEHRFQLIWPYTDLLLHDMGDGLADNRHVGSANGREWRTPPLWGIGLTEMVNGHTNFLHDGRARNLLEAIIWHGGEAQETRDIVVNLEPEKRAALIRFLESL